VNDLGIVIKQLIRKQGLTGQEVAKRIGITPPNLSQIVNGHAKPREGTFSKLCEVLGNDKKDEKLLVDAFLRLKEGAPEVVPVDPEAYQRAEIERAERFLEMKAQSIAFRRSVGRELDAAGLSFETDYCFEIYATDFLVNKGAKRFAIECKFNIQRDLNKTSTIAGLLKEKLNCDAVFIVVPYTEGLPSEDLNKHGVIIVRPSELITAIGGSK
jgi:transcriptional regulator with XRE-family HTH domain